MLEVGVPLAVSTIGPPRIRMIYEQRSCEVEFIYFKEEGKEWSQNYLHKNKFEDKFTLSVAENISLDSLQKKIIKKN